MKKLRLTAVFLCILTTLYAQEEIIEAITEHLIDKEENLNIENLTDQLEELSHTPININTADETELSSCILFTPFQVFGILKYRKKYGLYFSIYELRSIPGFDPQFLQIIAPFICANDPKILKQKTRPQSLLLSNFSIIFPESYAYIPNNNAPPLYPGSPLKTTHRFRYSYKNISAGAAYEKDAGEVWQQNSLPEHLSGYISIVPEKVFSNVILGNYQIHRGLGLVNGLGFSITNGINLNGYRRSYAKAFASTMEYNYYSGLYVQSKIGNWQVDAFLSHKKEDLSLYHYTPSDALQNHIRNYGLHRTPSEINGIHLALRKTCGFSVNRSAKHLQTGLSLSYDIVSLSKKGIDSIPEFKDLESTQGNISYYFVTYNNSYEIFGELAVDMETNIAAIGGANWQVNPALSLSSSVHYYQANYHGQFPKAYMAGENPKNQKGLNLKATISPFHNFLLYLNTDITTPTDYVTGFFLNHHIKNTILLSYNSRPKLKIYMKYSYLQLPNAALNLADEEKMAYYSGKEKIKVHYDYKLMKKMDMSGSFEFSRYKSKGTIENDNLMYIQMKLKPAENMQCTYRFLAFHIDNWENRIYCYEPGPRYSFLFPAFYGTGSQNILLINYKINNSVSLRSKIAFVKYQYKRFSGSGDNTRPGNQTVHLELQFEVRL